MLSLSLRSLARRQTAAQRLQDLPPCAPQRPLRTLRGQRRRCGLCQCGKGPGRPLQRQRGREHRSDGVQDPPLPCSLGWPCSWCHRLLLLDALDTCRPAGLSTALPPSPGALGSAGLAWLECRDISGPLGPDCSPLLPSAGQALAMSGDGSTHLDDLLRNVGDGEAIEAHALGKDAR